MSRASEAQKAERLNHARKLLQQFEELPDAVERLADDHRRAARLADAVAERWPEAGLDPAQVSTNMVIFPHHNPAALLTHLHDEGVRAGTIAPGVIRLVTHHDVDDDGVEQACKAIAGAP